MELFASHDQFVADLPSNDQQDHFGILVLDIIQHTDGSSVDPHRPSAAKTLLQGRPIGNQSSDDCASAWVSGSSKGFACSEPSETPNCHRGNRWESVCPVGSVWSSSSTARPRSDPVACESRPTPGVPGAATSSCQAPSPGQQRSRFTDIGKGFAARIDIAKVQTL